MDFGNQYLKIHPGQEIVEYDWLDVKSIKIVPFTSYTTYILRLKNEDGFFLFGTSSWHLLPIDNGDIGNLIEKKKKELDI